MAVCTVEGAPVPAHSGVPQHSVNTSRCGRWHSAVEDEQTGCFTEQRFSNWRQRRNSRLLWIKLYGLKTPLHPRVYSWLWVRCYEVSWVQTVRTVTMPSYKETDLFNSQTCRMLCILCFSENKLEIVRLVVWTVVCSGVCFGVTTSVIPPPPPKKKNSRRPVFDKKKIGGLWVFW